MFNKYGFTADHHPWLALCQVFLDTDDEEFIIPGHLSHCCQFNRKFDHLYQDQNEESSNAGDSNGDVTDDDLEDFVSVDDESGHDGLGIVIGDDDSSLPSLASTTSSNSSSSSECNLDGHLVYHDHSIMIEPSLQYMDAISVAAQRHPKEEGAVHSVTQPLDSLRWSKNGIIPRNGFASNQIADGHATVSFTYPLTGKPTQMKMRVTMIEHKGTQTPVCTGPFPTSRRSNNGSPHSSCQCKQQHIE